MAKVKAPSDKPHVRRFQPAQVWSPVFEGTPDWLWGVFRTRASVKPYGTSKHLGRIISMAGRWKARRRAAK